VFISNFRLPHGECVRTPSIKVRYGEGDHEVLVGKRASQIVDALDSLSPGLRRRNRWAQQNQHQESRCKSGDPATGFFLHTLLDTDLLNFVQRILGSRSSSRLNAQAGRAEGSGETARLNPALPEADGFGSRSLPGQAEGLPESSRGSSAATPPGLRSSNLPPTPEGSQNSGIPSGLPSGCTDPHDCQPGVCAPLRPPGCSLPTSPG
jgi:hypothetical protein